MIVYNGDHSKVKQDVLLKTAHVRSQILTLKAYGQLAGIAFSHRTMLSRQPVDEQPIPHSTLAEILETNPAGQGVIIEDLTRLISSTETEGIKKQVKFLLGNLPGMFSIRQHNTILGIGAVGLFHLASIEAAKRLDRTTRAKKAAASKNPDESKAASRKANAAKTALARTKALKLRQQIEKIRDSLPDNDRPNLADLARQLNDAGIPTPSGKGRWQTTTVSRVLQAAAQHDRQREELRQKMEARKQKRLQTTNRPPFGV
ncbi:hypothetical protein A8B83_18935 [Rhodobacteraceae bacterium EhC02]|nr:hypothetical protein A8B83_18935 [Rhodobacteraceae bacterium EhC02]